MASPPKIVRTLFEVTCVAGAQRAEHPWMVFSRLAQPPVVGVHNSRKIKHATHANDSHCVLHEEYKALACSIDDLDMVRSNKFK